MARCGPFRFGNDQKSKTVAKVKKSALGVVRPTAAMAAQSKGSGILITVARTSCGRDAATKSEYTQVTSATRYTQCRQGGVSGNSQGVAITVSWASCAGVKRRVRSAKFGAGSAQKPTGAVGWPSSIPAS